MLTENTLAPVLTTLAATERWFVGFSGGVDSTVLLHLLVDWRAQHPNSPPLTAIHVNHGLQAEATQWQLHCEALCAELGVALEVRVVDTARFGGGEAAARAARYEVFEEMMKEGDMLFLAHHLDDQVETFFLRLLRGAGVEGLAAMPATRPLGRGQLVRPLLHSARATIEATASARGFSFVQDPSNHDTAFDRNYLRQQVLPTVEQRWPAYRDAVATAVGHLAEADTALANQTEVETVRSVVGDRGIAIACLTDCSFAAAARNLRQWLREAQLAMPDRVRLEEFVRQVRQGDDAAAPQLATSHYRLCRFAEGVYLLPDLPPPPGEGALSIHSGQRLDIPGVGVVSLEVGTQQTDFSMNVRLELRWRQGGEVCRPVGRSGSASLKKVLQEIGLPPWWRSRVPLLCVRQRQVPADGDSEPGAAEILSIGGLLCCEAAPNSRVALPGADNWRLIWEPPTRHVQSAGGH